MTASRALPAHSLSRRQLLKLGAVGAIAVATGAVFDELATNAPDARPVSAPEPSPPQRRAFATRPDLKPPVVSVARRSGAANSPAGLVLLTPSNGLAPDGPLIVRPDGEPVWMHSVPGRQTTNLQVATYRGEPVLTWWEGVITSGYGFGEQVIVDSSYREVARVRAGNGLQVDLHEFLISPRDTALLLASRILAPGTAGAAPIQEAVVQEVDIPTGAVLFEWHSLPEIDPSESYIDMPTDGSTWDYLHANSIDLDGEGLLVSCRHTWAVYRIDRATGAVTWRLNGKRSDVVLPQNARFAWQHDARRQPDGTISIFDDGANGVAAPFESRSRGIVLAVDEATMRGRLVRSFAHPANVQATSQGSLQVLPGGAAFVGWGSVPRFSAFDARGSVTLDATFEAANQSYRSRLQAWSARPWLPPDVMVVANEPEPVFRVSWNGATGVDRWQLFDPYADIDSIVPVSVAATGFETLLSGPAGMRHAAIRALDADGQELGHSRTITLT